MDQFAQIAANGIGGNAALLEPVTPIPHETVISVWNRQMHSPSQSSRICLQRKN